MVIGQLPTQCARRYPDKIATVFKGETKTFAEFNARVNSLVHAFRRLGLKQGSKVSVLSRNNPKVLEILFAAAKAGMTFAPINFRLVSAELLVVLNDAKPDLFFVGDAFQDEISKIKGDLSVDPILSLDNDFEEMIASSPSDEPSPVTKPEDLFAIFYTSGTTGGPKAVMVSHENFLSGVINSCIIFQLSPSSVCFHVMPFYHTIEVSQALCQFYMGGTNVIVEIFDPDEFWRSVSERGVTHMFLGHTMLIDLLDSYKKGKYDKGSFRFFAVGGQAAPIPLIRDTIETLGPNCLYICYGLTEASPLLTYLHREEVTLNSEKLHLLSSVGRELPHCHVRVVDERDNDVAPGEMGEIIAVGPNIMQGYWDKPDDTKEALRDGWLRTGDMAEVDEEGHIYIVDRKKDLIISGGENISPREVEIVIHKHPAVSDCSVIGIPDEKWGEQVKAVVVLNEGKTVSEAELIEYSRDYLAKYKCPKSVAFVDALPTDPMGKVQKGILRKMFGES